MCGWKYDMSVVENSLVSPTVTKFKKVQHLSNLWTNIKWHVFYGSRCTSVAYRTWRDRNVYSPPL